MHKLVNDLLERYLEFGQLLKQERSYITGGEFDQLEQLMEKKMSSMKDIEQISANLQLPLTLEGQAIELYQLMVELKTLEDENILLLQEELNKVRKERSDVKTSANVLRNYQQTGVQERGIPKFFDKKK